MIKTIDFDLLSDPKTFIKTTKQFFISNGFKPTCNDSTLEFHRGNSWLNIVTFNPLKWKSKIIINVQNKHVSVHADISTFAQTVTNKEDQLWDSFLGLYKKTVLEKTDMTSEFKKELRVAKLDSFKYVKWAIVGGIAVGVPTGIIAYYTGIAQIAYLGAPIGAFGFMFYKLDQDKKKSM